MQSTITCYFKEEIDIDWDETDNCYGEPFDEFKEKCEPKVILEKLPESVLQKYSNTRQPAKVNVTPETAEKCSRCKQMFKNKASLRTHSYHCGNEYNLQCAHCSYQTKWKINLIVHISKIHSDKKSAHQTVQEDDCKFSRICQKCKEISKAVCTNKCERCFNQLLYQCKKCSKQFKNRPSAFYHWSTRCGVKGYFNCIKCDFKSVWRTKVIRHMIQTHRSSESNPEFDHIKWISLNQSDETTDASLYKCLKCTKIMENSEALSWHMVFCGAKHREKSNDVQMKDDKNVLCNNQLELNKCTKCGQIFNHIYSLNSHTRHCKTQKYVTKINKDSDVEVVENDEDLVLKSAISADERYARIKEMVVKYCVKCHEDTVIAESWGISRKVKCQKCKSTLLFKCKKCLKEYIRYSSMIFHLNTMCNPQEEFQCTKCNYKASVSSKVKEHYTSVHGTANARCKKCESQFKSIYYLRKHMRRCGVEPKFKCEHCPFKSKLKIYLKQHIFRIHMEPVVIDRGEAIKMSRQRFSRAMIHLKAHCFMCQKDQRLSERLKNCRICKRILCYNCKTCKKNFEGDDKNVCDHVKGYFETIKFECKRCGRGAMSEKSLWMHEYKCGVEARFRCRYCNYASNFKGNMMKHEKVKHSHEN